MTTTNAWLPTELRTARDIETIAGFDHLESLLSLMKVETVVRKKVLYVVTECMQNIKQHGATTTDRTASLTVSVENDRFVIISKNMIANPAIGAVKAAIDCVLSMPPSSIRHNYLKKLSTNNWSVDGTAGLGFPGIARKTGQNLCYSFDPVNNTQSLFHFQAVIYRK
jgi:hypothetical protein